MLEPAKIIYGDFPGFEPPTSLECEQALLGALLVANDKVFAKIGGHLREEHFSDPGNGRIYRAAVWMINHGREASAATLGTYFADDDKFGDVGWQDYLARLMSGAVTTVNVKDYADQIIDCWMRRTTIAALQEALSDACAPDLERTAQEVVVDAISRLGELGKDGATQFLTARQVRIASVDAMKRDIPCTSTGFGRLDTAMGGGLFAGKLYGLIARKKGGKTLFGNSIAANAASVGAPVLYIAGEMGSEGIEQRRWAAEIKRNALAFIDNKHRRESQFANAAAETAMTASESLLYADLPGMTFEKLRRTCARFTTQYPDGVGIVVDYLQLIRGRDKGTNQAEFMDDVSQWLADFCNERKIWAVVLAQENQTGNVRGGEGLRLACDMAFELARTNEGQGKEAWMEMLETRYTRWCDVGDEKDPAFKLNEDHGPTYTELEHIPDSQFDSGL